MFSIVNGGEMMWHDDRLPPELWYMIHEWKSWKSPKIMEAQFWIRPEITRMAEMQKFAVQEYREDCRLVILKSFFNNIWVRLCTNSEYTRFSHELKYFNRGKAIPPPKCKCPKRHRHKKVYVTPQKWLHKPLSGVYKSRLRPRKIHSSKK